MTEEPLLRARDLSKEFRWRNFGRTHSVVAVEGVSLELHRGKTLAIVGNSGAGKSTLGRMLLRLIEPDGGQLSFQGTDLLAVPKADLRRQRRHMQMIFQDPFTSFDPRWTIRQALDESLRLHSELDEPGRAARVAELLDKVRLGSFALSRKPAQLSGGELQRASLARALAPSPEVIVCDEPISALDVSIGAQILNLLLDLQESESLSLVFISHDLRAVRTVADDVMVMRGGRVVEAATADALFYRPKEEYTQELLRAVHGGRRVRHGREIAAAFTPEAHASSPSLSAEAASPAQQQLS